MLYLFSTLTSALLIQHFVQKIRMPSKQKNYKFNKRDSPLKKKTKILMFRSQCSLDIVQEKKSALNSQQKLGIQRDLYNASAEENNEWKLFVFFSKKTVNSVVKTTQQLPNQNLRKELVQIDVGIR